MLDESQRNASRISGGAAADPRRKDEFLSKGIPSSVGAPHGSFRSVLDMACLTSKPSHYLTPARPISAGPRTSCGQYVYFKPAVSNRDRRSGTRSRICLERNRGNPCATLHYCAVRVGQRGSPVIPDRVRTLR